VTRRRLDRELVRRGLVPSHAAAHDAILQGRVTAGGRPAAKPGSMIDEAEPLNVEDPERAYVSRGGEKLAVALDRVGIDPADRRCVDAGASTGGFTDVLLARGAAAVVALDVGYGQLDWRLRRDSRVVVMERTNVRTVTPADLPYRPDLVVADLSFISLTAVIPALAAIIAPGADLVLLVKPQFEASPREIEPGGVVREPSMWRSSVERVAAACADAGLGPVAVVASPLRGPAGNVEFFLHARDGASNPMLDIASALAEGDEVRSS
jgi:23S rRNA (cytidine1920-2'-O)/16S rRNA (cytidine1409-2'-O)-methyltransferase